MEELEVASSFLVADLDLALFEDLLIRAKKRDISL